VVEAIKRGTAVAAMIAACIISAVLIVRREDVGSTKDVSVREQPQATAPAALPAKASIERQGTLREDEMTITLEPHSGQEVKANMNAGESFVFAWSSEGGPVKADMHGEKLNAAEGEFTSYWKEKQITGGKGDFTAPFAGTHGWYFRNKGDVPVTVKVRTAGFYKNLFQRKG